MALVRSVSNTLRCSPNQRQFNCVNRLFCTGIADAFGKLSEITTRGKKSGNDIRLIGRVRNNVVSLPNGFDSFLVRTATKTLGKLIGVTHSVKINRNLIVPPSLQENDLVYVNGEVAYERFTSGSETISIPQIFVKKAYRLENNSDPEDLEQLHKDCVNEVKFLGQIGSEISDESATIFSFVTNTSLNSYGANDTFYGDWHRILILNENLRDFVRKNLKRSDRLLINGEIIYNKLELKDGNFATIASILATQIQKLESMNRGENKTQTTTGAQATVEQ